MRSFRKLLPFETERLAQHLLRLDEHDRAMRFSGSVSDAYVRDYARAAKWPHALVIGYFEDGVLRGAAELVFDGITRKGCELALTVEKAWQGRGIGGALFGRALRAAANRFIERLCAVCLVGNRRMQHIAISAGCSISVDTGQAFAEVRLPRPTIFSMLGEAADEGFGAIERIVDRAAPETAASPA